MAAPSASSILRVPGTLIWGPTDLGTSEPYGGVYLGTVRGIRFTPNVQYRDVWAEEFGSVVDSFYVGERPELRAVVRHPDSDMVNTTAPKAIASGSSGIHWLFRPGGTTGNTRAGTPLYSRAGKLLFAPYARTAHPMILMYSALPMLSDDVELRFSLNDEYGIGVTFRGSPDSSGRVYDTGQRANLVL